MNWSAFGDAMIVVGSVMGWIVPAILIAQWAIKDVDRFLIGVTVFIFWTGVGLALLWGAIT